MINEPLLDPETTWREHAECLSYPALLFFGMDDIETPAERRTREDEAKIVCSRCPVQDECLDYALTMREPYGIWGGLTEIERKTRLRAQSSRSSLKKV